MPGDSLLNHWRNNNTMNDFKHRLLNYIWDSTYEKNLEKDLSYMRILTDTSKYNVLLTAMCVDQQILDHCFLAIEDLMRSQFLANEICDTQKKMFIKDTTNIAKVPYQRWWYQCTIFTQ